MFELTAPFEIVTRRQFNLLRSTPLQFGYESAKIAFMDVGTNYHTQLAYSREIIAVKNLHRAVSFVTDR
jgi:hypothetical protein